MLDEGNVDAEQGAKFFWSEQFLFGTVGEDAAVLHHDDAVDFGKDVSQMVCDHQNADSLLRDLAESFTQLALSGEVKGIRGLVEEKHFRLMDQGAGDHDAPLLAGRHFANELRFEVRGLHELEGLVGAVAHVGRNVEVGPERRRGEETSDHGIETACDRCPFAGQFRGDNAQMSAELRNIPALAAEQAQLRGGRDDGIALAGDGFDERGFSAAVGAKDSDVFAVGDAEGDCVQDDVVAAGDRDVAHDEEVGSSGSVVLRFRHRPGKLFQNRGLIQ